MSGVGGRPDSSWARLARATRGTASERPIATAGPGLRLNEWIENRAIDGATIFAHACRLGLEGIVSKRRDSRYRSGRSGDWLKSKNPESAAVRREAWGRR
jgi:hypothetical protein